MSSDEYSSDSGSIDEVPTKYRTNFDDENDDDINDIVNDETNDETNESTVDFTNSNYNDSSASIEPKNLKGGRKDSKKPKFDQLYIQKLINQDLRPRIKTEGFKQAAVVRQIKNTVGIYCKVCKSDNVYVESKQVRSADEATTKFYTCLNCGNTWRFD